MILSNEVDAHVDLTPFLYFPYFSIVSEALARPSFAALVISGPGYTRASGPGPGLSPSGSTWPQSWAALRTNGSGFAQPLIPAAMVRMRSVADAPIPPQSSQALRYPGALPGFPSAAEAAKGCFSMKTPTASDEVSVTKISSIE